MIKCNINHEKIIGAEPNDGEIYEDLIVTGSTCTDVIFIVQGDTNIAMTDRMAEDLMGVLARAHTDNHVPVTVDEAKSILEDHTNCTIDGIDGSKGGRAWLDGEFDLAELEALCILIRNRAGDRAEGAYEAKCNRVGIGDDVTPRIDAILASHVS